MKYEIHGTIIREGFQKVLTNLIFEERLSEPNGNFAESHYAQLEKRLKMSTVSHYAMQHDYLCLSRSFLFNPPQQIVSPHTNTVQLT